MSDEIKPCQDCPHCGCVMFPFQDGEPGEESYTGYEHEENDCINAGINIGPELLARWNRRATVSKETAQGLASNLDTLLDEMVNIQSKLARGEQEGWEGSKRRLALKNSCTQALARFEAEQGGGI